MKIPERYQEAVLFAFHCCLWVGGIVYGYLACQQAH